MRYEILNENMSSLPAPFIDALRYALGADRVITGDADRAPFLHEERGAYHGAASVVLLPRSAEEVAAAVRLCAAHQVAVVPQGGNTGLVGGAVSGRGEVLISLKRMNRILAVDPVNFTMTVEAGAVLETVQHAAEAENRLFPLSLGAEGSCQIGGNIASNAGGINVLRYGNMRDLVLGLEVVLPDGKLWNGLRALHKDNSGYALRHLFIGSEGTLGIVTKAVLKLFPKPVDYHTALCGVSSVADAMRLLAMIKARTGEAVTAFELMSQFSLELACRHCETAYPIEPRYPWFVLLELSGTQPGRALRETLEAVLEEGFEAGVVNDAAIAESLEQTATFWRLRERIPEAQKLAGTSIKHDISVPGSHVPIFVDEASTAILKALPGTRICAFGHLGDGNLHYNLSAPEGGDADAFAARTGEMNAIVHDITIRLGGSISAEHGIGLLKRDALLHHKPEVELDLMRKIKIAIDPYGIMNPGKIFTSPCAAK